MTFFINKNDEIYQILLST